jgi:hypothetical protein
MVALLWVWAATAEAQPAEWEVAGRESVPLDGTALELGPLVRPGVDRVRVVLTGTVTTSIDGSEIDALGRRVVDRAGRATEGSYLVLPDGARVIESDDVAGRFVAELPVASSMRIGLDLHAIARRHLITRSEVARSLSGAIEVELLVPLAPAAAATPAPAPAPEAEPADVESPGPSVGAIAGFAIGVPLLALLAAGIRRRFSDS